MSDVPLGIFLSGGIDSSVVAALTKRLVDNPVKTFSVGYQEAQFSELSAAAETAHALGAEHSEVLVGMDDFFAALPKLVWHEDEPITWPSSVSLYFVSKLIADTPLAFADRCLELIESREARQRIAESAWDLVSSCFSWEAVSKEFEGLLAC